jgi:hypothetical protein
MPATVSGPREIGHVAVAARLVAGLGGLAGSVPGAALGDPVAVVLLQQGIAPAALAFTTQDAPLLDNGLVVLPTAEVHARRHYDDASVASPGDPQPTNPRTSVLAKLDGLVQDWDGLVQPRQGASGSAVWRQCSAGVSAWELEN